MNDATTNQPASRPLDAPIEPEGTSWALLFDAATPSVYRANAFRVTGAPVTATARDIARRSDRLRLAEKVGTGAPVGRGPLPLEPPPAVETVRDALHRVRDPERRLVDELFWFWPADPSGAGEDGALAALERGDTPAAVQLWKSDDGAVGRHNLAVLFHAVALDLEMATEPADRAAQQQCDRCWREGFTYWREALQDEAFWSRLAARTRELADPRLTDGTAHRIRTLLPSVLLSINARLAVTATEHEDDRESDRHAALIDASGFDTPVGERALERALEPLKRRLLTWCRTAEVEAGETPTRGYDVAQTLLDQAAPVLASLSLLRDGHPMRDGAHDQVALSALTCQIAFGNKTENWQDSLALLQRILPFAASGSVRSRVEDNRRIVEKNAALDQESGVCWFCGHGKPVEGKEIAVKLHKDVVRVATGTGTRLTWSTLTIKVPRCQVCATTRVRANLLATAVFALSAVMGIASCELGPEAEPVLVLGFGGVIAGIVAAAALRHVRMGGIKGVGKAPAFPPVVRRLAEGWAPGEKPPGVQ